MIFKDIKKDEEDVVSELEETGGDDAGSDSSHCSDEKEQLGRRRHKIREFVKNLPRVAALDFEHKEHLLSCK